MINGGRSRSICMENPTGEKGQGGKAVGKLGPSRKGSPAIRGLQSGETRVLADVDGPGVISHIWITITEKKHRRLFHLKRCRAAHVLG